MLRTFVRFAHKNAQRQKLLESIVRVDHAGELAADRIYAGQMAVLKGPHTAETSHLRLSSGSSVESLIKQMWDEEKEHLDTMERLCAKHNVPPTLFAPMWNVAAFALGKRTLCSNDQCSQTGAGTALLGKEGAMACTIAVEELIGRHYNDQIKQLIDDDPEVHKDLLQVSRKKLRRTT